jgi:LAO/AO transport system kinase
VVVSAPGLGDDIQAIKAGILEIADIHAVSKCDRPDANRTIAELKSMLAMGLQLSGKADWTIPVLATSAVSGEGLDALFQAIDAHLAHMKAGGECEARRRRMAEMRLLKSAEELLRRRFDRHRPGTVQELAGRIASLELAPEEGARLLVAELSESEGDAAP